MIEKEHVQQKQWHDIVLEVLKYWVAVVGICSIVGAIIVNINLGFLDFYTEVPLRRYIAASILFFVFYAPMFVIFITYFFISKKYDFLSLKEYSVTLKNLPEGIQFPNSLGDKLRYDSGKQLLIFKGVMSEIERKKLLQLSEDNDYKTAIRAISFRSSASLSLYSISVASLSWLSTFLISLLFFYILQLGTVWQKVLLAYFISMPIHMLSMPPLFNIFSKVARNAIRWAIPFGTLISLGFFTLFVYPNVRQEYGGGYLRKIDLVFTEKNGINEPLRKVLTLKTLEKRLICYSGENLVIRLRLYNESFEKISKSPKVIDCPVIYECSIEIPRSSVSSISFPREEIETKWWWWLKKNKPWAEKTIISLVDSLDKFRIRTGGMGGSSLLREELEKDNVAKEEIEVLCTLLEALKREEAEKKFF
ncbi:MAG TPA: hypothetical protein ACFYEM_04700 [Candidatus Hypogeohydataceae bacterium YC40]